MILHPRYPADGYLLAGYSPKVDRWIVFSRSTPCVGTGLDLPAALADYARQCALTAALEATRPVPADSYAAATAVVAGPVLQG